jgi:glycerol-3-phosphate O-acyltransferase
MGPSRSLPTSGSPGHLAESAGVGDAPPVANLPTRAGEPQALARVAPEAPGVLDRLLARLFRHIEVDPEAAQRLRDAHARGLVVHTLRTRRRIDPLYIRYALARLGLPAPGWAHDHFTADAPADPAGLVGGLEKGDTALLFLTRARTLLNPQTAYSQPHIEALVARQRTLERPILLLPETVLWTRRAVGLRKTVVDAIFGDRDAPGWLRELAGFAWHHRHSRFHVGAPVDLQAVLERDGAQPDRIIAKKVRWAILHHLTREEEIRTGPMTRSAARTRQMVLKDPALRRAMTQEYERGGEPVPQQEQRADQMLRAIAADMRYGWLRVLDAVVDVIWHRIYDGIEVDPEGLALVRRAARRGPVVLVPSHKSHVDYLVLSQVFFKDGMMPPHIAAGDNLNFWPMGHIFRRSGAFFIRRSFKGDKLYALVFGAYVRRLLKEGHAVEFFIEGGRSRTGKLLAPRMGMLSMCVDPVFEGAVSDVQFIPVSISYEKLVEAKSYARELQGGAKRKEDVTALLSSAQVLRSKYGRVYVDFAEPISLRFFAASRGVEVRGEADANPDADPARRNLVTQLGHRIVYGINVATRVTPTSVAALILLARTRRGLAQDELFSRAARVVDILVGIGARVSPLLLGDKMQVALRTALERLQQDKLLSFTQAPDGETIYQVNDAGRRALDYYKNNIIHFFVPHAIVAASVLAGGGAHVPDAAVQERARWISRLLKFEFSFRVDRAFEENFAQAAELLVKRRILERPDAGPEAGPGAWSVTAVGRADARELAGLLSVFFEAYRLAAEALEGAPEKGLGEKRFIELALQKGSRQVLEGRILRAEASAQPLMKTALSMLGDQGIIAKSGELAVVDPQARRDLVDTLSGLLESTRE